MLKEESKSVASRHSFGEAILELGEKNESIVVLEADLGKSTQSYRFAKRFPNRYFQMGIAESNMIGTATGLALSSKVAFICSFCVFVTGRYDIIRMSVAYSKANVKIVGTHAGIATGPDGNSQQAIEDISIMRSLPNMVVVQPCDHIETKQLIAYACEYKGPMFIRLTRQPLHPIYASDYTFEFGKGVVLKDGCDLTFFATGGTVYPALKASHELEKINISVAVVNIHTIKPIDKNLIIRMAKQTKGIITMEDHSIIGGLGSSVAEVIAENFLPGRLKRLGLPDCFGESGATDELYAKFGLDSQGIATAARNFLKELSLN